MSSSLKPHGLQHSRLPSAEVCSNSCSSSRGCHPTISSSVSPSSSCPPSFPTSGFWGLFTILLFLTFFKAFKFYRNDILKIFLKIFLFFFFSKYFHCLFFTWHLTNTHEHNYQPCSIWKITEESAYQRKGTFLNFIWNMAAKVLGLLKV